jgi:hypothetical protein
MTGAEKIYTTKSLFGLAKSPGLNLDNEGLHDVVLRVTGKSSIKLLTQIEIKAVVRDLIFLKEICQRDQEQPIPFKATREATQSQQYQIKMLEKELGWNNNPARLKGFMKKYSHKESIKCMAVDEASKLIEALKGCKRNMNGSSRRLSR